MTLAHYSIFPAFHYSIGYLMVKYPDLGKVPYTACSHILDVDYGPGCGDSLHSAFHSPAGEKEPPYGPAWHPVYPGYTTDCGDISYIDRF
jgi:hypothetical protein